MTDTRFPRTARVRARSDFDRIFKQGRRVALPLLALHVNPLPESPGEAGAQASGARLGLAVSRKVDPKAVGRNRIKRVLRDAFRHCRSELPAADYVIVARPGASRCSSPELRDAFASLLRRAQQPRSGIALPVPAQDATMRVAPVSAPASDSAATPDSDVARMRLPTITPIE